MLDSRVKIAKMRLLAGIGSTLPLDIRAVNAGYNPAKLDAAVDLNLPTMISEPHLSQYEREIKIGKR